MGNQQLKKLKKRRTFEQSVRKLEYKFARKYNAQITQEKDRDPGIRLKLKDI